MRSAEGGSSMAAISQEDVMMKVRDEEMYLQYLDEREDPDNLEC